MHYIIEFFIPLLYFLLANATMVFITKKTFGKCLPLTLMASSFAIFFSQVIFQTFNVGIIVNILFALSSILIYILLYDKKKELFDELIKKNFTKGFVAFITIYVLVFFYDLNRKFGVWDEFSHWGVMLKEMLRLDKFYSVAESTLMVHKDYPPIIQLFELFYTKISGGYSEATIIKALHLLEFSLFIPAISELSFKNKNIIKNILMNVLLFFIVLLNLLLWDVYRILNSILIDQIIGVLIAYILFFIIAEKDLKSTFSLITVSISLSFLIMLKQIAIIFYMMILFALVCKLFVEYKDKLKIKKKVILKILEFMILIVIVPTLFYFGWKQYTTKMQIEGQFNTNNIEIQKLYKIITRQSGEEYQQESANNFIEALSNNNISTSNFKINYILSIIIGLTILFIIYKIKKATIQKSTIVISLTTLLIGAIGYAFVMLTSYTFLFGSYEGPILASYERYMSSFTITIFSIVIMLYFWIMSQKEIKKENDILIITIFIAIGLITVQNLNNAYYIKPAFTGKYLNSYKDSQYIIKNTEENSKIFIITQNPSIGELNQIKYYANPRKVNSGMQNWPIEEELSGKIKDSLKDFDYLYLYNINDRFIQKYKTLFVDDVIEERLYRIIKKNDSINFELIKEN